MKMSNLRTGSEIISHCQLLEQWLAYLLSADGLLLYETAVFQFETVFKQLLCVIHDIIRID